MIGRIKESVISCVLYALSRDILHSSMSSQVQEIKNAVDIATIIGERVKLTRSGKNLRGLCPFHSEKSPSFFVTPDMQRYKCFGCGKSGDVLNFIQEYESLPFPDALQLLADRAGIRLEKKTFSKEDQHRKTLFEVLDLASEYYHYLLTSHESGAPAREYLKNRGVFSDSITTFKLGYALNSWDAVQKFLIGKKKFSQLELEDAGLIIHSSGGRYYDRFRDRVMFPLTHATGATVGFSGRVLNPNEKEAKYINSPETALYHKSELLFGYSVLKQFMRKEEEVVVVEGELDAISSYQAGVKNVVAIKGSAFTEQQFRLLSRTVKRVVLSLDADSAGVEATKRAIETSKQFDLSLRVLPIVGGKDPDEIARENPAEWREMVKHTVSAFEFLVESALKKYDLQSGEGKRLASKEIMPILSQIANAIEQSHYVSMIADRFEVKPDVVFQELEKQKKKNEMGGSLSKQKTPSVVVETNSPRERLERFMILSLLNGSTTIEDSDISSEDFSNGVCKEIFTFMQKTNSTDPKTVSEALNDELKPAFSDLYLESEQVGNDKKTFVDARTRLRHMIASDRLTALGQQLKKLENSPNQSVEQQKVIETLQNEMSEISTRLVSN